MFLPHQRNYLGNKRGLLDTLGAIIGERLGTHGTLWDAFAGTGGVAYHCATRHRKIIATDTLESCTTPLRVFLTPEKQLYPDFVKYLEQLSEIWDMEPPLGYYAQQWWGDKYFPMADARRIDNAREWLESCHKYKSPTWDFCMTSLLYGVDRIAQTYGHYDAYKDPKKWSKKHRLVLEQPDLSKAMHKENHVMRVSANTLVQEFPDAVKCDVAFFDPPYNERDYATNYHLLENLVRWDKQPCNGKTAKIDLPKSAWTRKREVQEHFKHLVAKTQAKHIVMTYNNQPGNLIPDDVIYEELGKRGELSVVTVNHKMITTGLADVSGNQERIFIVEVTK